jgi:hypothetical protein
VLEGVTLAEMVEFVVEVLVNLAGGAVLDEKAAEDSETSHPENLAIIHSISTVIRPNPTSKRRPSLNISASNNLALYFPIRS